MAFTRSVIKGLTRIKLTQRFLSQPCRALANHGGSKGPAIVEPDDIVEPPIPGYIPRENEPVELKRARILYQSRKRGMLENGLIFSTFASKYLSTFSETQLNMYDKIINEPSNDWQIYRWMTGAEKTPEEYDNEIMNMLKEHVNNSERQSRTMQPGLHDK